MIKHIRISPLFFFAVILAWQTGNFSVFFITYISLIFHESIHLWFLCRHKIPVRKITIEPFGISIQTQQKMPENTMIYLSAPIGNLVVAICLILTYRNLPIPFFSQWILANLSLGLVNLLPTLPLDGGRALLLLLQKRIGKGDAESMMRQISLWVSTPLILLIFLLIFQTGGSFGIFTVLIFITYTLLSGNRLWEYKKLQQTAFRKEKGQFSDTVTVEHIGVPWNYPANKLIKKFRGDKYYVVNVFRDGFLVKTITETQILNRILTSAKHLSISEC